MLHNLTARALDHFLAGGVVMAPLGVVALAMWSLAIHKLRWFAGQRCSEAAPEHCLALLRDDGSRNARQSAPPSAPWQKDILAGYLARRTPDPELNRELLGALRAPHESQAIRHVGAILLLAAVAPLLGLLGTVTGMISTFDVISQFGTGNARALASGISEALVSTQTGLVVAVPGLLLGGFLQRRAKRLTARMELFCIRLQQAAGDGPGRSPGQTPAHDPIRVLGAAS